MFVPSVQRVHLPRSRTRSTNNSESTGHGAQSRAVSLSLGGLGTASIHCRHRKWSWLWAVGCETGYPRPQISLGPIIPSLYSEAFEHPKGRGFRRTSLVNGSAEEDVQSGPQRSDHTPSMAVISNSAARFGRISICWVSSLRDNQLYMSSFLPTSAGRSLGRTQTTLNLSVKVCEEFESPIRQVVTSPIVSSDRLNRRATSLVVRSKAGTHLLHAEPDPAFVPPSNTPPVSLRRIGYLSSLDTENRHHVDVALDPNSWGRAVVVDEGGGVWLWWSAKERVNRQTRFVLKLSKIRDTSGGNGEGFYRVAFGTRPDTVLIMSRTTLEVVDLVSPSEAQSLLTTGDDEYFTSLDKSGPSRDSGLVCAVTNREVLWIDDAGKGEALARWSHECGGGASSMLEIICTRISPDPRQQPSYIVMVQDPHVKSLAAVQVSEHGPLTFLSQPWSRVDLTVMYRSVAAFTPLPDYFSNSTNCLRLCALENDKQSLNDTFGLAPPGMRRTLQGRWAWITINDVSAAPTLDLEEFAQELRNDEVVLNKFMTLAELGRDCAYQGGPRTRSSLLRMLRFSTDATPERIDSVIALAGGVSLDAVGHSKYTTALQDGLTPSKSEDTRDAKATLWLSHDLTLSSSMVRSATARSASLETAPASSPEDLFAAATASLSLEETCSAVQFSYLSPKTDPSATGVARTVIAPPSFAPPLLGEWTVGEDPSAFQWQRPSSSRAASPPALAVPRPIRPLPASKSMPTHHLVPSPKRPSHAEHQRAAFSSPPPRLPMRAPSPLRIETTNSQAFEAESPALMQTQVEPGPYGARPEIRSSKKKTAKRRQGGF